MAKAEFKVGLQTLRIAELENENAGLRSARCGTESLLQDEIRRLEKLVSDREEKIELLHKQLAWLRKDKFGVKSEAGGVPPAQDPAKEKTTEAQTNETKIGGLLRPMLYNTWQATS